MVATISPAATGVASGSVATVTASSTAFSASMRARSARSRPGDAATRLTRPVAARLIRNPGPEQGGGDPARRRVLRHVAGLQPGGDHRVQPGGAQRRDGLRVQHRALLQHPARRAVGVGEHGALRLRQRRRAEDHAQRRAAPHGHDLRQHRQRDLRRGDGGDVRGRPARGCGPARRRHDPGRAGGPAAWRGSSGCRARRCRTPRTAAPGPAPGRPAWGRASASRSRCGCRAAARPAPRPASRWRRSRRGSARRWRRRGAGPPP